MPGLFETRYSNSLTHSLRCLLFFKHYFIALVLITCSKIMTTMRLFGVQGTFWIIYSAVGGTHFTLYWVEGICLSLVTIHE